MFPGVSGFHWSPIHLIFLAIFGMVLIGILATLTLAWWRTMRDLRTPKAQEIRWHLDFEDLPAAERQCRHALTGTAPQRLCPRGFDCRECTEHDHFVKLESGKSDPQTYGLDYPPQRFYHRGHTWVEPQIDGTLLIGLDDLGTRVAGTPTRIEWPEPGTRLTLNSPAWTQFRGTHATVVRSPLDGEVLEVREAATGPCLRIRPAANPVNLRHLLAGQEVSAWLRSELDRLQLLLATETVGATLADGGVLIDDLPAALPKAPWDEINAAMFQEP